jgi:hypothetical protein
MSAIEKIWQEHGCDGCMIDFDICDEEILAVGERVYCSGCGGYHQAGVEPGPLQTYIVRDTGEFEVRDLPRDAAEKAAWLAERAPNCRSPGEL